MKSAITLLILLALTFGGFLLFRGGKPTTSSKGAPVSLKSRSKKAPPSAAQLAAAHLELVSLPCANGLCSLKVRFKAAKVCHMADLDILRLDLKSQATTETLLTLEPMDPEERAFPVLSWRIPEGVPNDGQDHEFTFPPPEQAVQLGLFLCLNAGKTGRCRDAKVVDSSTILMEIALRRERGLSSADKVYFFQSLVAEEDSVAMGTALPKEGLTQAIYENRLKYVLDRNPHLIPASAKSPGTDLPARIAAVKSANLLRTLLSLPLEAEKGIFHLVVPVKDPNCSRK